MHGQPPQPPALQSLIPTPAVDDETPVASYGMRTARGGMIMTVITLAGTGVSFLTQIALAWFLKPDEFGIVAVVASVAGLVAVLRDAGAPIILIERQAEFDRIAGSVFWLSLATATLCGVLTVTAAPFAAAARDMPILVPLLLLTAARFPIGSLGTVSHAKLMIDMRWSGIAIATLVQTLATSAIAIYMAWRGWGVYSLIIPAIIGDALRAIVLWTLARTGLPMRPRWEIIAPIIASSVFIVLSNLTLAARTFADYLALSFLRGDYETGLYYYAFIVSQALSRLALASVPGVLAPVFAKVKHDEARHAGVVTNATHMFAAIGVLPIVLQGALAWPLFRLFLDAKWEPAAPLFAILSLAILACFLSNMYIQALWANGFYRAFFVYSAWMTPLMIAAFVIGAWLNGATGVAWAGVIAQAVDFAVFSHIALKLLKVPYRPTIAPLWRPLVAALPAALVALALHYALPNTTVADIARIAVVGIVGSTAYLLLLRTLWPAVFMLVWRHALGALR